jgi:hypothetical protein
MEVVFCAYIWAWRMQPVNSDKLRRTRMYHALCSPEDNKETIRLLEEDPYCQIVFATIAFPNGLNVKSLVDSLSLGFVDTVDQAWQEKGRVGRVLRSLSLILRGDICASECLCSCQEASTRNVLLFSCRAYC